MRERRAERRDCHRPGAIIPAHYEYVRSYHGATSFDGWPVPSWGVNCELDYRREVKGADGSTSFINGEHAPDGLCCIVAMNRLGRWADNGRDTGTFCCTVCGTHYVYGDVWRHVPTGDLIHIGHDCADKYTLLADRSAFELELGRAKAAAAVACERARRSEARDAFLAAHPGLADALELDHRILHDLKDKLVRYLSLSDKQVALAFKLAEEVRHPKPAEVTVPAPEGSGVTVRGTVLSVKEYESFYGDGMALKVTVKVATPDGYWLAWGTLPRSLSGVGRGAEIELVANLKRGREPHFALMSRPRGGRELTPAPEAVAA
jgi:hypothetical protein